MVNNEKIIAKDNLESLRTEIRESEKARIELLRYKLVAVASLAALGFGFQIQRDNAKIEFDYVLCIVPFVCAYIDLLCYHNTLRILVIACYLKHHDDPYEGYIVQLDESYNKGVRHFFNIEDLVLFGSSILLSFLLEIYSIIPFFKTIDTEKGMIFLVTAFVAEILICFTRKYYDSHQKALSSTAKKIREMPIINNKSIKKITKSSYLESEIKEIYSLLYRQDTFLFSPLENGLFHAANLQTEFQYTGYSNVWVRDNIHIAHAYYVMGGKENLAIALKNIETICDYFIKCNKSRFEDIISGKLDFNDSTNRPHIRFNGKDLSDINEKWSHAQNDALGYFLWFFCKLYNDKKIPELTPEHKELLALFALYFEKIEYWHDEDNGHWEEAKKIEASSIGVVVAALTELKTLVKNGTDIGISTDLLDDLIKQGQQELRKILPNECIQTNKHRSYDAALLFLIYPLDIVQDNNLEEQILRNITQYLQGEHGIRRYIGDSYWCADYKDKLKPELRTIDVSDNMSERDSLLQIGQEAQWCIFDPIISVIYGRKYQETKKSEYLELQTKYFNRSLAQLTSEDSPYGGFKCPELYYLEKGQYVPNDATPLLWTQANLWIAFKFMEASLAPK
jgi:hypothetical protein